MSRKAVAATEYRCDGCGSVQLINKGEEVDQLNGYNLRGFYWLGTGGGPVDVFACQFECIENAIRNNGKDPERVEYREPRA